MPLPTSANDPSLRSNLGKWAVPTCRLPAVAHFLHDVLPNEPFDPHFLGQHLTTTYFDTEDFTLRKARVDGERYFVLRLRCYGPPAGQPDTAELYALSVKTEAEKWRTEINAEHAALILAGQGQAMIRSHLPSHRPPPAADRLRAAAAGRANVLPPLRRRGPWRTLHPRR